MIHTNRIVTVGEQECIIDRPIVLYRGDREVEIEFTLVGNEFMFSEEGNVIKSVNASHGQLVLNTPSGEHMFSELAECHEGKVVFVVTKEMIDEFIEMGFYSFQIRLYDSAEMKSRVTIPPVMNGFDIRNPIAAEDETNVVDQGIVDYARIFKDQSNEELPTFDWTGAYNKTEWVHHDVITENKMNKIEDALYSINANVKESDVVMLNALDNVKKDADKYVKEHMAEVEADVDEFERNLNTGVEQFKIDTNAAMTAHKNEVNEELEGFSTQLAQITKHFNNVNELKNCNNLKLGQLVGTLGYYTINDNGQAKYKIVTFEEYKECHSLDIKDVITGADEYGSFTLPNGYIAMILTENYTTPEQWGAKGNGITNNTIPFIHMYGKTKTGVISFKAGATYLFEYIDYPNPYKTAMIGTPLGGYDTRKPLLAHITNLTIEGNNSSLVVGENNFCRYNSYDIDFSILQLGGNVDGLTIRNLTIDGNGFTQDATVYTKNTKNHNIAYITGGSIKNILIENCTFMEGGCVNMPSGTDFGGDGILIIAPDSTENITIRNNKFINVGRWAIAFDLNFSQNRHAKNVTIDNNFFEMIASDAIKEPKTKRERNLGFIDFEIYHSWENLKITNNTVMAGSVGIAIGGGTEALSTNVFIEGNTIISRVEQSSKSNGYYYVFSFYNQNLKNLYIRNNHIEVESPGSDNLITFTSSRNRYLENLFFNDNFIHFNEVKNTTMITLNNLELRGTISIRKNIFSSHIGISISNPVINDKETPVYINITNNDLLQCSQGYYIRLINHDDIGCYNCYKFNVLNNLLNSYQVSVLDGTFVLRDKVNTVRFDAWGNGKLSLGLLPPTNIGGYVVEPRLPANQESTQVLFGKYTQGQDVLVQCTEGKYLPTPYKLVCTKSGCGAYSHNGSTYKQNAWIANETNPSYRTNNGKMYLWLGGNVSCGEIAPTHSTGIVDNWRYIDEVAEFKKITF